MTVLLPLSLIVLTNLVWRKFIAYYILLSVDLNNAMCHKPWILPTQIYPVILLLKKTGSLNNPTTPNNDKHHFLLTITLHIAQTPNLEFLENPISIHSLIHPNRLIYPITTSAPKSNAKSVVSLATLHSITTTEPISTCNHSIPPHLHQISPQILPPQGRLLIQFLLCLPLLALHLHILLHNTMILPSIWTLGLPITLPQSLATW